MLVDLNPLPYKRAVELVKWCFDHGIEQEKCFEIIEALAGNKKLDDVDLVIDVPDHHMTFFILKWI